MNRIPDYPFPTRRLDGTEVVAGWQDGQQVAVPATSLLELATDTVNAVLDPALANAEAEADRATSAADRAAVSLSSAAASITPFATAALIGGNVNEWSLTLPPGIALADFSPVRFLVPATPTGTVWITGAGFGRHRLDALRSFPVPAGLLKHPALITISHNDNGSQWVLVASSDTTEECQINAGMLLPDTGNPSTPEHWYFRSRRGFQLTDGATVSFFAPFTSGGPVTITIDGFATGVLRKSAGNQLSPGDIAVNMLVSAVWPGPSSGQNSFFATATGIPQDRAVASDLPGTPIAVDSPLFVQSDYPAAAAITKNDRLLKIVRPIADEEDERYAVPTARDRARMRASWYEVDVRLGDATKRQDPTPALVLVDGVAAPTIVSTVGIASLDLVQTIRVEMDNAALRNVDLVFPYDQPVSIVGRRVSRDAVFAAPVPRPANLLVTAGDSITQGFSVDSTADQWAHRLATAIGYRLVNHGYGGRRLTSADGSVYGAEAGAITTYMIGANDVTAHTDLSDITARLNAFWAAFFGAHPQGANAKLLMLSQTWMEAGDGAVATAPTGPQYRTTMAQAVAAAAGLYPNLRYKSGLELTDGPGTVVDGTHPTSNASVNQIAPRLLAYLKAIGWVPA